MKERIGVVKGKSTDIKRFWPMVGPWIASSEIHKHSNVPIVDDNNTVWFVLYLKGGRSVPDKDAMVGFCCVQFSGNKARLRHHFVRDEYKKYRTLLFKVRSDYLKQNYPNMEQEISTRDEQDIDLVKRAGFKSVRTAGSYRVLRKEAS